MKILDLFCCAGGASMGLHQAFPDAEIVGVDIDNQPRYPFTFVKADAVEYPVGGFDLIWASPPCQGYCALKVMPNAREHPLLIPVVRKKLQDAGKPWIMENVVGAPLEHPFMLCGSMFKLESHGYQVRRHRLFETSFPVTVPFSCQHAEKTMGIYGAKVRDIAQEKRHYSKPKETRGEPVGVVLPQEWGREATGITWTNMQELSESIPPAYSRWIGEQYKSSALASSLS